MWKTSSRQRSPSQIIIIIRDRLKNENSRLLCGKLVRGRGVPLKSRDWRSDTTSLATAVLHNKQTNKQQIQKQTPLLWQAILRTIQIHNELVPKINGYTTNKWTKEHNKQILV